MKKDKKELAKLALAGLLLAATLPAAAQAEAVGNERETFLAVAGCSGGCNHSTGNSYGCQGKAPNPYGGGNVAEADNFSTPPGSGSGAMNRTRPSGSNGNMDYNNAGTGARTTGGSNANPNDPSQQQGYRNTNNPYGN